MFTILRRVTEKKNDNHNILKLIKTTIISKFSMTFNQVLSTAAASSSVYRDYLIGIFQPELMQKTSSYWKRDE